MAYKIAVKLTNSTLFANLSIMENGSIRLSLINGLGPYLQAPKIAWPARYTLGSISLRHPWLNIHFKPRSVSNHTSSGSYFFLSYYSFVASLKHILTSRSSSKWINLGYSYSELQPWLPRYRDHEDQNPLYIADLKYTITTLYGPTRRSFLKHHEIGHEKKLHGQKLGNHSNYVVYVRHGKWVKRSSLQYCIFQNNQIWSRRCLVQHLDFIGPLDLQTLN